MMDAFNVQNFYNELDKYFAGYDNDATEKFLKGELEKVDSMGMILGVTSSCPSCNAGKEVELTDEEKAIIWQRSEARIAILNEMACFYRGISKWEPCIDTFRELMAEMEFSGLEHSEQYAVAVINMAGAYRLVGKFDKALELFTKADSILKEINCTNDYDWASLYNNTGLVYQDQNELQKALEYFERALDYTRKVQDNEAELATALSNISLAYYRTGNQEKADKSISESLDIFRTLDAGMNPHYAGAMNTKATYCFLSGDFAQAAELFQQAAEKTKMIFGENKDFVACCRNCSAALAKAGKDAEAAQYQAMADEAAKKL